MVVSFQNGVRNGELLRSRLTEQVVVPGMVPFNVLNRGAGVFHQGTEGALDVQRDAALAPYVEAFQWAGLPLTQHDEILPVQWAKLLLNLNNPINALSNVPLRDELSQRAYRRCLAAAQAETLAILDAAGIEPAQLLAVPMRRSRRSCGCPTSCSAARIHDAGDRPAPRGPRCGRTWKQDERLRSTTERRGRPARGVPRQDGAGQQQAGRPDSCRRERSPGLVRS